MMSGGKNPFYDDDEVDDNDFLKHNPHGQSGYLLGHTSQANTDWELRQKLLLEERQRIEERTLQSAKCSIGIIHESEQVGIATADELVRQKEQLQNVEKNLDVINSTMRISQKHINSMKSVFGGIKSFFSKNSSSEASKGDALSSAEPQSSQLKETVGDLRATQKEYVAPPHPALRVRGINYDDDEADDADFVRVNRSGSWEDPAKSSTGNFDDQLDKHLEDISMGLGRLKNLGIGLKDEITDQNEMLDRLYNKADNADETLEYQNRQIKRILKK